MRLPGGRAPLPCPQKCVRKAPGGFEALASAPQVPSHLHCDSPASLVGTQTVCTVPDAFLPKQHKADVTGWHLPPHEQTLQRLQSSAQEKACQPQPMLLFWTDPSWLGLVTDTGRSH